MLQWRPTFTSETPRRIPHVEKVLRATISSAIAIYHSHFRGKLQLLKPCETSANLLHSSTLLLLHKLLNYFCCHFDWSFFGFQSLL